MRAGLLYVRSIWLNTHAASQIECPDKQHGKVIDRRLCGVNVDPATHMCASHHPVIQLGPASDDVIRF